MSPEEEIRAWVWAVHRDLKARNEAALSEWRDKALSQPMVFEVMASDDEKYYRTCNMREAASTMSSIVVRTQCPQLRASLRATSSIAFAHNCDCDCVCVCHSVVGVGALRTWRVDGLCNFCGVVGIVIPGSMLACPWVCVLLVLVCCGGHTS